MTTHVRFNKKQNDSRLRKHFNVIKTNTTWKFKIAVSLHYCS